MAADNLLSLLSYNSDRQSSLASMLLTTIVGDRTMPCCSIQDDVITEMITSYGLGDGRALLRLYCTFGIRSAGLLWLRICLWHTNWDSAGVRFNTPFHGLVWRPPFELASSAARGGHPLLSLIKRSEGREGLKISEGNLPPSLLSPFGHPLNFTFHCRGVFHVLPWA